MAPSLRRQTPGVRGVERIVDREVEKAVDSLDSRHVISDETIHGAHGTVHCRSAVCPHLGAIVTWNSEEQTWDCPAHGSRFDAKGDVLNGPANADLQEVDEEEMAKVQVPQRVVREGGPRRN